MSIKSMMLVVVFTLTSVIVPGGNHAHAALISPFSNIEAQDVRLCDGTASDVDCDKITITVADKGNKKCKLDIDKPVAVVTVGADTSKSLKLVWELKLATGSTGVYKFDKNNGVDIAGDKDNHFKDGAPDGDTRYKVPRDKTKPSKKAFNYTITVLRQVGGDFTVCGVVDPIIVNRD